MARRANRYVAEVLRIILLVFGRDITGLGGTCSLLLENGLHMGPTTDHVAGAMLALSMGAMRYKVGTLFGRLELVLVEEVDVGFGA